MKNRWLNIMMLVVGVLIIVIPNQRASAQLEDAVKQLTSDNAKGYLQPFVTSFGANMNSGMYHSASISNLGFTLKFDIITMATLIGDAEKKYNAVPPQPFNQNPVPTATVFGDMGTVVQGPYAGVEYQFQNGQVKTNFVVFAAPQLTIGDLYGTQAVIRYVPIPKISNFPKTTLFGIGATHNVSQYIPAVPVDVAATIFFQTLDMGDIFKAKSFSFGAQASKSFAVLTCYGGLQYESSSMKVAYTYEGYGATGNEKINIEMDGANKFRFIVGLGLNLAFFNFYADANFGKVTMLSSGIGFGF